jgi:hypothetical protein
MLVLAVSSALLLEPSGGPLAQSVYRYLREGMAQLWFNLYQPSPLVACQGQYCRARLATTALCWQGRGRQYLVLVRVSAGQDCWQVSINSQFCHLGCCQFRSWLGLPFFVTQAVHSCVCWRNLQKCCRVQSAWVLPNCWQGLTLLGGNA